MTPTPLPPERLERIANLERPACGDNSCRFTRPAGMGTNGGCRCLKVGLPDERVTVRRLCLLAMAVPDLLSHIAYLEGEVVRDHEERCWMDETSRGLIIDPDACPICTDRLTRQTPDPSEPGA